MIHGEITRERKTREERGGRFGCRMDYREYGARRLTGTWYFYATTREDALELIRWWENIHNIE